MVRDEIKNHKDQRSHIQVLAQKERLIWERRSPFPDFRFTEGALLFHQELVSQEEADKQVSFMKEEYRVPIPRYIDPKIQKAEMIFWIILRLFRLEANK